MAITVNSNASPLAARSQVNRELGVSSSATQAHRPRIRRISGVVRAGKAAVLAALVALAPAALAMSLGDAVTASHLGDALKLQIPLTEANGWRDDQIQVAVSGDNAHLVRNLSITLQPAPGGYQIIVQSDAPLREPYLALTVAVRWPTGNLQRSYDILLDPPVTGSTAY